MTDKWHWLRHKWTPWNQYEQSYDFIHESGMRVPAYRTEVRQSRKCLLCGKTQDRLVAYDARMDRTPKPAK